MRSREFITENVTKPPHKGDVNELAHKIKRDCQPYLQQSPEPLLNTAMYRGIKKTQGVWAVEKDVRLLGRKPSDTDVDIHDRLNRVFVDRFGEPFRDALFLTGKVSVARAYTELWSQGDPGSAYVIFPKGDFTFIWSPEVEDLYTNVEEMYDDSELDSDNPEMVKFRERVLRSYINTDLKSAINSKHEIMMRVGSYYGIREEFAEMLEGLL